LTGGPKVQLFQNRADETKRTIGFIMSGAAADKIEFVQA
jgi:hypothetical protein